MKLAPEGKRSYVKTTKSWVFEVKEGEWYGRGL